MQKRIASKQSFELKKHVGAIHSTNRLTLLQRKIANALIYNAYNALLDVDEHQIHIGTLCELINYDSKDSKKIKKALVALISTVVEWNLIDKNNQTAEGVWNASAIIADASIDGPVCTYSYSKKMRQLLYHPDVYGRLNMQVQARFKSSYGLALYENCIRYQNINQTPWFDLPTFRKLMGVEDGRYLIFRDFKRRVLDNAVSEVNQHAPIYIVAKLKKMGRQVSAVQFLIQKSEVSLLPEGEGSKASNRLLCDRLREDYGLSKRQVELILAKHREAYILEKIRIVESSSTFKNGKIGNLAKYLETALEQDFQPAKTSIEVVKQQHQDKMDDFQQKRMKEERLRLYRAYQDKKILEVYHSLPEKQRERIEKEFSEYIKNNVFYTIFQKEGLSNILVADRLCNFVRSCHKDLLGNIVSFEDFCRTMQTSE